MMARTPTRLARPAARHPTLGEGRWGAAPALPAILPDDGLARVVGPEDEGARGHRQLARREEAAPKKVHKDHERDADGSDPCLRAIVASRAAPAVPRSARGAGGGALALGQAPGEGHGAGEDQVGAPELVVADLCGVSCARRGNG